MWATKTDVTSQNPFESFSDWFEYKVQIPNFDDIHTLPVESVSVIPPPLPFKASEELSFVLGHGHLTPPQSPPASEVPLQPVYMAPEQPSYVTLLPTQPEFISEPYVLAPPTGDLEREMAVVDEVVRDAAQQWEAWESSDTSSRSSDTTEDSDDPEWMPVDSPVKVNNRRQRQSRPYNVEDRRQRKKEQNKNAATRYRMKKKAEVGTILQEERGLEDQNASLQSKVDDINREITYLKGFMRDMFKAKGLLK